MISILKEEKDYARLFFAGVLNGIGDRFSQVALLALLLQVTGSGLAVGLALAIRVIPFLFFGPLGGMMADRFSRRKILVCTDLGRILFALSFVFVNDVSSVWVVYLSSFFLAAGEAIYAPTRKSAIPLMVKEKNMIKVNGLEQVMVGVVLIGGSFSGGVVTSLFGANFTFFVNGASFLIAAVLLAKLRVLDREGTEESMSKNKKKGSFFIVKDVIFHSSLLLIILLSELLIPLFNGIDNVLLSVYAVQEFQLGDVGVGIFYGSLGIGLMLSFPVAEKLKNHLMRIALIALMFEGFCIILLSQSQQVWMAIVFLITAAFFSGLCNTCFDTMLMRETPKDKSGLIFGLFTTISNTMIGISMFLAGLATVWMPNRLLGLLGGTGFIISSIFLFSFYYFLKYKKQKKSPSKASC
ncbi:MFS transporter [Cytobacillus sp. FSL R7-0696]|uniref:MFS transporter n=1 Tax=Cytobacillus sp. FSL R7-0696 TaxID=2921691 RepID=UPI0030F50414